MADSIKSARKELADDLRTELGRSYAVVGSSGSIDSPRKPTLAVSHRRVSKMPSAPLGRLSHAFELLLVAPASASDDSLDDWLTATLEALDTLRVIWTVAERGTFESLHPCYRITLTTTSNRKAL